jgi:hypothetical protein
MWNPLSDRYDPDMATAELDRVIITVSHFLRHIRHNKDYKTADVYHHKLFKLENDARRVMKETKDADTGRERMSTNSGDDTPMSANEHIKPTV